MRVYISGKIGEEVLSEATRQKFARAEELLQARGFETFNPTTSGLGKGAKAEYAFAIAIGLQVYYADELYHDGTLRGKSYDKNRLPEVVP